MTAGDATIIRKPLPADVSALGRLHAEAWQAAYAGQMPDALLATVTVERRTAMWQRILDADPPAGHRIVVAEVAGSPAGIAWTGPYRGDGAPAEDAGELYAINVAPPQWGTGVGAALLAAAHDALTDDGYRLAARWVLPGNARARRFYERSGWVTDGVRREEENGGFLIPEVRYVRRFS